MPYSNLPKALWGKMDDCVSQVKQKNPKANAYAVCFASIMGSAAKKRLKVKGG